MIDIELAATPRALDIRVGHLNSAQAKWDRLTASDYAGIGTFDALVAAVESRYSLPHAQAKRDVELWLRDVGLGASVPDHR